MPFATRPHLFRLPSLALAVAVAGLAASCQSSRPNFSFQPVPSQAIPARVTPAVATPATPVDVRLASKPAPPSGSELLAGAAEAPTQAPVWTTQPPHHAALKLPLQRLLAAPLEHRLVAHLHRKPTTEGTAESGLGRVALFFIGVVLALLAGLAALVNLIFSVGFFTALGYTAAGLVVLALLYLLLSGKKKKA